MTDLLVDTDVLIDHLRGAHRLRRPEGVALSYSTITRAELFAGPAEQLDAVKLLLGPLTELDVTRPVAELAGGICSTTGVALPDALIAATALRHSLAVMTRNRSDFEPIDGLDVVVPSEPGG